MSMYMSRNRQIKPWSLNRRQQHDGEASASERQQRQELFLKSELIPVGAEGGPYVTSLGQRFRDRCLCLCNHIATARSHSCPSHYPIHHKKCHPANPRGETIAAATPRAMDRHHQFPQSAPPNREHTTTRQNGRLTRQRKPGWQTKTDLYCNRPRRKQHYA
jgi:hypothetical protein